jgi:phospholipase/carboxylesterase
MALRPLSGSRLPPLRGQATHLVVLVHGYGADGNDLIELAGHWQSLLPTAAFVAPNAPDRVPGAPSGFQWFGLTRMDPHEMAKGVAAAGPVLDAFLDQELGRLGLSPDRLALVGFSQGTMLSLHVGLNRPAKPAAIVGFSGLLAAPPPPGVAAPPIFLAHGNADQVIPVQAMFAAAVELGASGAAVQWHMANGMGHGIDPAGLDLAGLFLSMAFRGLLKREGEISCPVR